MAQARYSEIIRLAAEKGLPTTNAGLAKRAGVSRQTMHRLMHGGHVRLDTAEALARVLGVEVEEIFGPETAGTWTRL